MIVYGDHARVAVPSSVISEIETRLERARDLRGQSRSDSLIAILILAGELQQGLIDWEMERLGADDLTPLGEAAAALTLASARLVAGEAVDLQACINRLRDLAPKGAIRLKEPEGYAFYAVHPRSYLEVGRGLAGEVAAVVGLRSIGTSLGAIVAAGAGLDRFFTVRPTGDPFDRRIDATPVLLDAVARADGLIAIVDEGPGLSGSSFGAAADWLEGGGVDAGRLIFLPSHGGDPGSQASSSNRARWERTRKVVPSSTEPPGTDTELEDLSAGGWREALGIAAPADPPRERLKYRVTAAQGPALLRFAGYGASGERKLVIAEALHGAGFGPAPMSLADGFLTLAWIEGAPGVHHVPRSDLISRIGRYLAFRDTRLPAPAGSGATLSELVEMARHNFAEAGLPRCAEFERYELRTVASSLRSVLVDGRMHPWEWIVSPEGTLLKLDALDHHAGHDLIGPRDIAWDLAGATVEFDFSSRETSDLFRAFGRPVDPAVLSLHRLLYLGFQIGLWSMAREQAAPDERAPIEALLTKYRNAL